MEENGGEDVPTPTTTDVATSTTDTPPSTSAASRPFVEVTNLRTLCQMLISPEQLFEVYNRATPQERLYMQQQDEQERRRRFLLPPVNFNPPEVDAYSGLPSFGVHQANWDDVMQSMAQGNVENFTTHAKQIMLNKCGDLFIANKIQDKCAICLQCYEPDDTLRKLNCVHYFHQSCIDRWIWKEVSCPVCRAPVIRQLNNPYGARQPAPTQPPAEPGNPDSH